MHIIVEIKSAKSLVLLSLSPYMHNKHKIDRLDNDNNTGGPKKCPLPHVTKNN